VRTPVDYAGGFSYVTFIPLFFVDVTFTFLRYVDCVVRLFPCTLRCRCSIRAFAFTFDLHYVLRSGTLFVVVVA